MKKLLFFLLAAGLFFAADPSVARDSTWLASESVMTSQISRAEVNVPVGTIIPWSSTREINDSDKWLICDGRAVPHDTELYLDYGMTVTPNLNNDFIRGTNSWSEVGKHYEDSLRSHNHEQPGHVHPVDVQLTSTWTNGRVNNGNTVGKVTNTATKGTVDNTATKGQVNNGAITGIAAGQTFSVGIPNHTHTVGQWGSWGSAEGWGVAPYQTSTGASVSGGNYATATGTGNSSSVTGNLVNTAVSGNLVSNATSGALVNGATTGNLVDTSTSGNVINGHSAGEAHMSGDNPTYFTSMYGTTRTSTTSQMNGTETAPRHMKVIYLIRCNR